MLKAFSGGTFSRDFTASIVVLTFQDSASAVP